MRGLTIGVVITGVALLLQVVAATPAAAEVSPTSTTRIVNANGEQFDNQSDRLRVSADGRYVVYDTSATNVIPGFVDNNFRRDVYVFDRQTGTHELISWGMGGQLSNGQSTLATISGDGRYVAFTSDADNLVPNDDADNDVFRYDRQTGVMEKISLSTTGGQANSRSNRAELNGDGRWVAFNSLASNLVAGDTNGQMDVFLRDMDAGITYLVSKATDGTQGDNTSFRPEIDSSGNIVAFVSDATTLSPDDDNARRDVYVHNFATGETKAISTNFRGDFALGNASRPSVSRDGQWVAFQSSAPNIIEGDRNGSTDSFLRDIVNDVTYAVSIDKDGLFTPGTSARPVVSADGRYVAFNSANNLLVENDEFRTDVFVRDMFLGMTYRVSETPSGDSPTGLNYRPEISDDATVIVYRSAASDIVVDDTNGVYDLFVAIMDYAAADTEPPSVPDGVVPAPAGTTVDLTWNPSTDDDSGVDHYDVLRDGIVIGTTTDTSFTDDAAGVGLAPLTTYAYSVTATDVAGNESIASTPVDATTGADSTPPSTPGQPTATAMTATSITLEWAPSTDNVAVARYDILRDSVLVGSTADASTTFEDTGLTAAQQYSYEIVAVDGEGNMSAPSPAADLTTTDNQPPTVPDGVAATPTGTSVGLTWNPSTDDLGVDHYDVLRDGVVIASTPDTNFTDDANGVGLAPLTTYSYTVIAVDIAGNASAPSTPADATTGADTTVPSVPGVPSSTAATATSISLTWGPSTDNVGIDRYDILRDSVLVAAVDGATTTYEDTGLAAATDYDYVVVAVDPEGNQSEPSPTATLATAGDVDPPDGNVDFPAQNEIVASTPFTATGTATDNAGIAQVRLAVRDTEALLWMQTDGSFASAFTLHTATLDTPGAPSTGWTFDLDLPDGEYAISLRVTDTAGLSDPSPQWRRFSVQTSGPPADTEPPAASLAAPTAGETIAGPTVSFNGGATDNVGVTDVRLIIRDQGTGLYLRQNGTFGGYQRLTTTVDAPGAAAISWAADYDLPPGTYLVRVIALDAVGNLEAPKPSAVFTVT